LCEFSLQAHVNTFERYQTVDFDKLVIVYISFFLTGGSSEKFTITTFLPLFLSRRILNAFARVETEMTSDIPRIGFIHFGEVA